MRTAKLLQHLVVTSNAFVGHCVRARANGRRICLMSQRRSSLPGRAEAGRVEVEEAGGRGKDGGDWLRIGPGPGGKGFLDKRRGKKGS